MNNPINWWISKLFGVVGVGFGIFVLLADYPQIGAILILVGILLLMFGDRLE